jgi:hypothetical protein
LSFDHIVGEREQLVGNVKPERFGGLEIDGFLAKMPMEPRATADFFARNVRNSALVKPSNRRRFLLHSRCCPGAGSCAKIETLFTAGAQPPCTLVGGKGTMRFEVVRHEHPNILVMNRQTYETYRFTVGDDGSLAQDGPRSDLYEARRTAVAFLARCANASASSR